MNTIVGTHTTSGHAFGSPGNWALLPVVAVADLLLALALLRADWVIPVVEYILLAVIMVAAIRLAVIVCDPRQPRRPGPNGNGGGRWGGDPPWPPAWYILLLLAAVTIGIILTYTGLYWHFGRHFQVSGWQEGMTLAIGTVSTVSGPATAPPIWLRLDRCYAGAG